MFAVGTFAKQNYYIERNTHLADLALEPSSERDLREYFNSDQI